MNILNILKNSKITKVSGLYSGWSGKAACWRFIPALALALFSLSFLNAAPAEAG
jgi:hypothetical protein